MSELKTNPIFRNKPQRFFGNNFTFNSGQNNQGKSILEKIRNTAYLTQAGTETKKNKVKPEAEKYFNEGVLFMKENQIDKAYDRFIKAMEADPSYAAPMVKIANIYILRYMRTNDPNDIIVAGNWIENALEIDPKNIEAHETLANLYITINDLPRALEEFNLIIDINPEYSNAYLGRGNVYFFSGDIKKSEEEFLKAIEKDPKNGEAYNALGCAYAAGNKIEEAVSSLNKAIEINPKNVQARLNLANAYLTSGDFKKAREKFEEVLKLGADSKQNKSVIYTKIGISYYFQSEKEDPEENLKKALSYAAQAVEFNYANGEAHYLLAKIYFKNNDLVLAAKECRAAIDLQYEVPKEFREKLKLDNKQ